jgi:hypothetical protein
MDSPSRKEAGRAFQETLRSDFGGRIVDSNQLKLRSKSSDLAEGLRIPKLSEGRAVELNKSTIQPMGCLCICDS